MGSARRILFTLALLLGLASVSAVPAQASTVRMTGGMGLSLWPMELHLGERTHSGVGVGISGRLMARFFDHLRLQTGILQGEFEESDLSQVKRSLIFFGVEAEFPLFWEFYGTVGARAGGQHLVMTQTREQFAGDRRFVRDLDSWSPMLEPMASVGWLIADKYHLELEGGAAMDYVDGGLRASFTMVLAVYFRMWDSGW